MRVLQKAVAPNVFGAIGYMLLIAAWTFSLAVVFAIFFEATGAGRPNAPLEPAKGISTGGSSSQVVVIASQVIAGLAVLLSAIMLVALPYFIGKWGSRIVKGFMKICHIDMTAEQLLLVKGGLAVVPLLILMVLQLLLKPEGIVFAAMFTLTVAAAALAVVAFLVQTLLARRQKLSIDRLW